MIFDKKSEGTRSDVGQVARFVPIAYLIHLLDERFVPPGIPYWATHVADMPFTNDAWLAVNAPILLLLAFGAWGVAVGKAPRWLLAVAAGHLTLHGVGHLLGTIGFGVLSPGVATGLLLCLPVAYLAFQAGRRNLSTASATLAFLLGALTFQPFWHMAMLELEAHSTEPSSTASADFSDERN